MEGEERTQLQLSKPNSGLSSNIQAINIHKHKRQWLFLSLSLYICVRVCVIPRVNKYIFWESLENMEEIMSMNPPRRR